MKLQNFVGNHKIVELLRQGELPQSSLFTGPEGVGKKTLALSLAALANCKQPTQNDLCGNCSSCMKAIQYNHPDISLFQPEKELIRTKVMRRLGREAQFRPFEGRLRFFIIDEAEKMTSKAANSILKTLEEPPDTSRLVLITAFPQRLLATVRSRCQSFPLRSLDRNQVKEYVTEHLESEDLEVRAAFSEGSIGRSLSLNTQELLQDRDQMLDILLVWCEEDSFALLYEKCEQQPLRSELKKRERVRHYADLLQLLLQDVYFLHVKTVGRVVNQDRIEDLDRLSKNLELNWIRNFLYHLQEVKWDLERYVNPLMCFETLWLMNRRNPSNARSRYSKV